MKCELKFTLQYWLIRSAPFRWLARFLSRNVPVDKGFGKFKKRKDGRHDV